MSLSFEEFAAARGAGLLRLAVMLSGDPYLAEDLVQTALAKAYRHWDRVAAAASPEAYVRRIVVREHLSWRRRSSSRELVSANPHDEMTPASPTAARDLALTHANTAAGWALLARLPRKQRAVLVLRYYEDLSDQEIASILHCSDTTVRSNASRALSALRAVLPGIDKEMLP